MNIQSKIKVMNNIEVRQDFIVIKSNCQNSITLEIPGPWPHEGGKTRDLELDGNELFQFLLRSAPEIFPPKPSKEKNT